MTRIPERSLKVVDARQVELPLYQAIMDRIGKPVVFYIWLRKKRVWSVPGQSALRIENPGAAGNKVAAVASYR